MPLLVLQSEHSTSTTSLQTALKCTELPWFYICNTNFPTSRTQTGRRAGLMLPETLLGTCLSVHTPVRRLTTTTARVRTHLS
ncbi:hypothetical protein PAXRUDRAFT_604011 [Paxillus rubicundulus Ve08.2h10]|uniref:Uncharacterized protein n=1 Tax=Paxillus rubicundulus Ve08.2h10 TaxID=930991 RepID=A0A0D0DTN4_9AGAM|nr:hypothetical protein PAXRUDRAFT_604011 [Paxillus rubicundulus Ve08.2h10]